MLKRLRPLMCAAGCWTLVCSVLSQDKPAADAPALPKIAVANPLAVPWGQTSRVVLRGWQLMNVSAVHTDHEGVTVRVLGTSPAAIPARQTVQEIGDTQLEIEITTPAPPASDNTAVGASATPVGRSDRESKLTVVTPHGQSIPYPVGLELSELLHHEHEPNDGFQEAQPLSIPVTIGGQINQDRDVDVFAFVAVAGQRLSIDIWAARHGSALDAQLTVFSSTGAILAEADDNLPSRDCKLEARVPRDGKMWLSVTDAHDRGGPAHPYRLTVTIRP